jgi:stage II sporulation protein D
VEGENSVRLKAKGLDRRYPGNLVFSPSPDGRSIQVLDEVPLDRYVACVTASESDYDRSQPEYLKALAAVVRQYALSHRKRHPGYDLCDLAHCQVYQGLPPDLPFWEKIARESAAWSPACGPEGFYFHQCCGGLLIPPAQAWGGKGSFCSRTGPDELEDHPLCQDDPHFRWKTGTSAKNIEKVLQAASGLSADSVLQDLHAIERTGPRNKILLGRFRLADGHTQEIRIGAQKFVSEFGKRYGWRVFPSLWFDIERGKENFVFKGRGFGHGVGLCQAGALRLAQKGWDWKRILGFYFPGVSSSPKP